MAASLAGLGLLLGGNAWAQDYRGSAGATPAPFTVSPNYDLPSQGTTPSTTTQPVRTTTSVPNAWSPQPAAPAPRSPYGVSSNSTFPAVNSSTPSSYGPAAGTTQPRTQVYEKAPYASPPTIQRTSYQPLRMGSQSGTGEGSSLGYEIQTEPPGPSRLFRLDSESMMLQRIVEESKDHGGTAERITFPEEPIVSTDKYAGRMWPLTRKTVEPHYVCYDRLYFQELNSERYGWDLGIFQPVVSTGIFYAQLLTLPYNWGSDPCRCYDCSAGYCMPGDPVPYRLYPPGFSLTGLTAEAAAAVALTVILP